MAKGIDIDKAIGNQEGHGSPRAGVVSALF